MKQAKYIINIAEAVTYRVFILQLVTHFTRAGGTFNTGDRQYWRQHLKMAVHLSLVHDDSVMTEFDKSNGA